MGGAPWTARVRQVFLQLNKGLADELKSSGTPLEEYASVEYSGSQAAVAAVEAGTVDVPARACLSKSPYGGRPCST